MTTDPVSLTLTFHGPFHVGGSAQAGIDSTLDRGVLLPGSSLKGLLRAEAGERLGLPKELIATIFGAKGSNPSPWWFSDAEFDDTDTVLARRARIRIGANGITERGFLMVGEMAWVSQATCIIEPTSDAAGPDHRLVLRAAARSVSALGGERRRGSGWVSITDADDWTAQDTEALLKLRSAS